MFISPNFLRQLDTSTYLFLPSKFNLSRSMWFLAWGGGLSGGRKSPGNATVRVQGGLSGGCKSPGNATVGVQGSVVRVQDLGADVHPEILNPKSLNPEPCRLNPDLRLPSAAFVHASVGA